MALEERRETITVNVLEFETQEQLDAHVVDAFRPWVDRIKRECETYHWVSTSPTFYLLGDDYTTPGHTAIQAVIIIGKPDTP